MKQTICRVCLLIGAVLGVGYFTALQIASPADFSFSYVWFGAGLICLTLFIVDVTRALPQLHVSRGVRRVCALAGAVALCAAAGTLYVILTPDIAPRTMNAPYVIILGGGIDRNGHLSDVPVQRLKTAAAYLRDTPGATAIVSGGKGLFAPAPEAPELARVLSSFGVSSDRILQENKALDTIENFEYSIRLIALYEGIPVADVLSLPIVVVTSDFHLARAERIARRCGLTCVYGLASKTPPLFMLNTYCREILAYAKLNLRILFTGRPCTVIE